MFLSLGTYPSKVEIGIDFDIYAFNSVVIPEGIRTSLEFDP